MAKKKRYVEKRARVEVVIAYLFVLALCGAMFYYIFQLRSSIFSQYDKIDTQDDLIHYTSEFTLAVHEAQGLATQFSLTDESKYLKLYNDKKNVVEQYADSIKLTTSDTTIINSINEIQALVVRKGQMSYIMSRQFYHYDPWAEIYKALEGYPNPQNDISAPDINEILTHSDSIQKVHYPDSLITDIRLLAEKAKTEYQHNINSYRKKINELVASDNALSQKISNILIKLNQEIIASTTNSIIESEAKIERNIYISTVIAGFVLFMIVLFIILIISDVNKGLRARKAAENAQQKTEEIMESRHKLLLSVSHDIKTPLTSILGNLDLMDNSEENNGKIEAMKQSANHILNLLNNLLDFSRLEQGKLTLNSTNFNINGLCDETATMFQPIADHKSLVFNYINNISQGTVINADELKIKQILGNIISNGIKYTIKGHVDFIASVKDNNLIFNINDTGLGIPQDRLDDIFKPFVRIENHNTFAEGSGYGMSVAKGLCDLMNGQINVSSEVDKGTAFEITIPITIVANDNDSSTPPTSNDKTTNVLIVDDDNTLLTMMENMIAKLGGQSTVCSSAAMLEKAFNDIDSYDYILTDREMGALTGNGILKKVKQVRPDKPVILMTARIEYDTQKALDEGFDGLISKPFTISQLANTLHLTLNIDGNSVGKFSEDFGRLYAIMGNDDDAVRKILSTFVQSICDDMLNFNETVEKDDFEMAKKLCHKVLPILKSLEQEQTLDYLNTMNRLNSARNNESEYPTWKDDTIAFMKQIDEMLDMLSNKYGIY